MAQDKVMNRRQFLNSSLYASTALLTQNVWKRSALADTPIFASNSVLNDANPIAQIIDPDSKDFTGDAPDFPHEVLWDKWNYLKSQGGIPQPKKKYPVVIVGGGIAGLLAADRVKHQGPLLLEQAPRFGGNSKGEKFQNAEYTIGAAYVTVPEDGDENDRLYHELDLMPLMKKEDEMSVFLNGVKVQGFWNGETDPERRYQFQEVFAKMKEIYENSYPEIPTVDDPENHDLVISLDQMNFFQWLNQNFTEVHPHILEYFQLYCWSSFGGNINEVSAAQMLNFVCSETDGVLTLPGGNSKISQKLFERLLSSQAQLRHSCLVVDIKMLSDSVQICFLNANKELETVLAEKCLFAAPKVMGAKLIDDCPPALQSALRSIQYRPYIVGNLLLNRRLNFNHDYDLYSLQGSMPKNPNTLLTSDRGFSDIVISTWGQDGNTVLSLFKPMAFQGAHQYLFAPGLHEKMLGSFKMGLQQHQSSLGLNHHELDQIRLTRWGHAMPVAFTQMLSSGRLKPLQTGWNDRVIFIGQDTWVNPSFETAHATALKAVASL